MEMDAQGLGAPSFLGALFWEPLRECIYVQRIQLVIRSDTNIQSGVREAVDSFVGALGKDVYRAIRNEGPDSRR